MSGNINCLGCTNVAEFRHSSWWNDEIYNELEKANIIFCGISHPTLPDDAIVNGSKAYYRFHGVPDLYYSGYEHKYLVGIAGGISSTKKCKEAFIYFNNTASMAAIENCIWLKEYCEKLSIQFELNG